MDKLKITSWIMGIVTGASIGLILPTGLNVIVGVAIAISLARWWQKVSVVEVEDEEYYI